MADRRQRGRGLRPGPAGAEARHPKFLPSDSTTMITFTPDKRPASSVQLRHGHDDAGLEVHRRPDATRLGGYDMTTDNFGIGGMHCASCAARNERVLQEAHGRARRQRQLRHAQRARASSTNGACPKRALHEAVVDNGYQVLTARLAQEHKRRRRSGSCRRRGGAPFLRLRLAAPVAASPCSRSICRGTWPGAISASGFRPYLSSGRHPRARLGIPSPAWCAQARNLAANMDTLISLGTLAALLYSLWAMADRRACISISRPAQ